MSAVSPHIHNACIVIISSALCNDFLKTLRQQRGKRGKKLGIRCERRRRKRMKGGARWNREEVRIQRQSRMRKWEWGKGGGRSRRRDVQNCIHANDFTNKTDKQNVCFRELQRKTGKQNGSRFLIRSWMQPYGDADDSKCTYRFRGQMWKE